MKILVTITATILTLSGPTQAKDCESRQPLIAHEIQKIEGWTVHVDKALLSAPANRLGRRVLNLLRDRLAEIARIVPDKALSDLRKVPIWLDHEHELKRMQYHPAAKWLTDHGYDPAMEKGVHLPQAVHFLRETRSGRQPWAIMHELAHAYHDRVLGFDEPRVKRVFKAAQDSRQYEDVLRISGKRDRHYALTNHKEFFAEMTEAYLGTNDFYPFVSAELRDCDPETFALLRDIWGQPRRIDR